MENEKLYQCEGCGQIFNRSEIEDYGSGFWCHVIAIPTGNFDLVPEPCGPVVEKKLKKTMSGGEVFLKHPRGR